MSPAIPPAGGERKTWPIEKGDWRLSSPVRGCFLFEMNDTRSAVRLQARLLYDIV